MKKAIVTLVMALALTGFVGLTGAIAATPNTSQAPRCTAACAKYIGSHGSCPTMASAGATTPSLTGALSF